MSKYVLLCLLVVLCCVGSLVKGENPQNKSISESVSVEQRWEEMEENLKRFVNQGIKMILPTMMEGMGKINISSSCTRDFLRLIAGARKTKSWAMKIIGANAGIPIGMAFQTFSAIGAYDQCVLSEVRNEHGKDKGQVLFRGKYCTVDVRPPLPTSVKRFYSVNGPPELKNFSTRDTFLGELARRANVFYELPYHIGLCVPSGCLKSDIDQLAGMMSETLSTPVHAKWCEVREDHKFTPLIIAILTVYSFIFSLVLAGSFADYYFGENQKYDGMLLKMMLSFSIKRNFKRLFNISSSSSELKCLHGMRFFSISWIILSHTYMLARVETIRNVPYYVETLSSASKVYVYRGHLAVETFFFMSGMLSCYTHIRFMKDLNMPWGLCIILLRRIWRLLPSVAFVIAFVFLFDLLGSGPLWHDAVHEVVQGCYENWWTNLIFIGNFHFVNNNMCLLHTWYVSCDTQVYVFALLTLIALSRKPKLGVIIAVVCIVTSMAVTAAVTLFKVYPPAITLASPDLNHVKSFLMDIHFKPYTHVATYTIGILAGYLLITKPKIKIPKTVQVMGWCAFVMCTACIYFGPWRWNKGISPSPVETLFFSGCSRATWALSLAWMVICCVTGHGGIINTILSWKLWIPLGRLTFLAYLIHPLVQHIYIGSSRTERSPYNVLLFWEFFGYLFVTYSAAIGAYLAIESPFASLEKLFLERRKSKRPPVQGNEGYNMDNMENMEKISNEELSIPIPPQNESIKAGEMDNPGLFVQRLWPPEKETNAK